MHILKSAKEEPPLGPTRGDFILEWRVADGSTTSETRSYSSLAERSAIIEDIKFHQKMASGTWELDQ